MGTQAVVMYQIMCDCCYDRFRDSDGAIVRKGQRTDIEYTAGLAGWKEIDRGWFCPKCVARVFIYDKKQGRYVTKGQWKNSYDNRNI